MRSRVSSSQQRACTTRGSGGLPPPCCRVAARPPARLRVAAMQSGAWAPQPQPQPQQQPLPPQQQQQQQPQGPNPMQQQGGARPGAAPLARTAPQAPYAQQGGGGGVFLELTQVLNKQVITRTSGRCLGTISGAWMDPGSGSLVSFDLDERRQGSGGGGLGLSSPARAGNIPLTALRQIGDVVLVHDEAGLYEQDLDGRLGFVNPVGLGVVTRAGDFLGKVRDLSFSPDSGAIRRVTYDEFGLPFLPLSFFDCYSVAMADVLSIGRGELLVYDDAKYRERKESAGLFAAIPSLLKSLNGPARGGGGGGGGGAQLALPAPGSTSDMYRLGAGPLGSTGGGGGGGGSSRFLPTDYSYEQWQADLRRWEAETGMTYEQYLRSQGQVAPRTALPPAGSPAAAPGYASAGGGYGAPQQPRLPQQQQQQAGYQQQPLYQQQQPMGQPQWQQPQQQQQPRYSQQQYAAGPGQQQAGAWPGAQAAAPPAAAPRGYGGPQQQQQPVYGGMPQQQQPQQPRVQQPPLRQQQPRGANAATGAPQQQQQQQQRPAAAAAAGLNKPLAPTAQQQPRPQQPQSEQQPQNGGSGRPAVDEWMDRETRPRIADALADGVLPSSDDVPQPTAQQPVVQQEVA